MRETRPDDQLFYDTFKASPIGIPLEDLEGRPLFVNPALCSTLGISEEEMRSKHYAEFSPPEDAEKDWALFEQLRHGSIDNYHLEKRFSRYANLGTLEYFSDEGSCRFQSITSIGA